MKRDVAICVVLAAAVAAVYFPVAGHGFVNFDDPGYVVDNPHVRRGLTWEGAGWAVTATAEHNWHPLTWLSHMLDGQLFGAWAGGHHLSSVVLHAANSILLYFVLKRLTGAVWPSAVVAALLAVHPLHVESVAWVSERKDVLSVFFLLLALLAYARYTARPGALRYAAVAALLVLGLASKPMVVTAPFLLLLLDWWPLGRLRWGETAGRCLLEKVPLLILVAAACAVTIAAQQEAVEAQVATGLALRIQNGLVAYAAYIGKMFWPARLAVLYPFPEAVPAWQWLGAAGGLAAVTAAAVASVRRRPYLAVGWLWFLGTLVPVIGLVRVGAQAMADRYAYIPLIGLYVMLAWGAADLAGRRRHGRAAALVVAAGVLAALGLTAHAAVGYWRDPVTLLRRTLEVTAWNPLAHNNLGGALMDLKQVDAATVEFIEAVRLDPDYGDAHFNLGCALAAQGRWAEAEAAFRRAVGLNQTNWENACRLATALVRTGRVDEGLAEYDRAGGLAGAGPDLLYDLGNALLAAGRLEAAAARYREAIRLRPDSVDLWMNLGVVLGRMGRMAEAAAACREAIRLDPENATALHNLAWIVATTADPAVRNGPEAVRLSERACRLAGTPSAPMLDALAAAYAAAGRFPEAIATAERAAAQARAGGEAQLAGLIEGRLALYRAGQAVRVP